MEITVSREITETLDDLIAHAQNFGSTGNIQAHVAQNENYERLLLLVAEQNTLADAIGHLSNLLEFYLNKAYGYQKPELTQ